MVAGLITVALAGACSSGSSPAPIRSGTGSPPPLANGVVPGCTDAYTSTISMGPLQDGTYLHYICENGKVTRWWIDNQAPAAP